jgi:hypothetical protein
MVFEVLTEQGGETELFTKLVSLTIKHYFRSLLLEWNIDVPNTHLGCLHHCSSLTIRSTEKLSHCS